MNEFQRSPNRKAGAPGEKRGVQPAPLRPEQEQARTEQRPAPKQARPEEEWQKELPDEYRGEGNLLVEREIDPNEPGFLKAVREHWITKPALLAAAIATGAVSSFERMGDTSEPQTEAQAVEYIREHFDSSQFELLREADGTIVVREKGFAEPDEPGMRTERFAVRIPGQIVERQFSHLNNYAGLHYERPAGIEGGEQEIYDLAYDDVQRDIDLYSTLGLNANDTIESVQIIVDGFASAEGTQKGNDRASEGRAVRVGLAYFDAFAQSGVDASKIELATDGKGALGSIEAYIDAAETNGYDFHATTARGKRSEAIRHIHAANFGRETDPALLKAHETQMEEMRRADGEYTVQHVDVVLQTIDKDLVDIVAPVPPPEFQVPAPPNQKVVKPEIITDPPFPQKTSPRDKYRPIDPTNGRNIPPTPQRSTGLSSYSSIPRGYDQKGQHNAGTGRRQYQSPQKRSSSGGSGGRRNGSR